MRKKITEVEVGRVSVRHGGGGRRGGEGGGES